MLEEKDGSTMEQEGGLEGSDWVADPKARTMHRVWGGRFGPFVLERVCEGREPVFAEGLLENSSLSFFGGMGFFWSL